MGSNCKLYHQLQYANVQYLMGRTTLFREPTAQNLIGGNHHTANLDDRIQQQKNPRETNIHVDSKIQCNHRDMLPSIQFKWRLSVFRVFYPRKAQKWKLFPTRHHGGTYDDLDQNTIPMLRAYMQKWGIYF